MAQERSLLTKEFFLVGSILCCKWPIYNDTSYKFVKLVFPMIIGHGTNEDEIQPKLILRF